MHMAVTANEVEIDSLSSLEERITRAVELVTALKHQNEQMSAKVKAAEAERDAAIAEARQSVSELESLRAERKQVRTRIEKLLGQMDLLSAQ